MEDDLKKFVRALAMFWVVYVIGGVFVATYIIKTIAAIVGG